ncbi:hypothetical protein [Caldibacillus debilis]|jgi:hypothetical protein|uniref:hypothetical protein n=1 Tax=Caldibacillus debilis TaxID=301148 RepID=UPI000EA90428|nr:hypothetical protein [Caldibacillus debilis]
MDRFSSDNFITGFFFAKKEDGTVRPLPDKGKTNRTNAGVHGPSRIKAGTGQNPRLAAREL